MPNSTLPSLPIDAVLPTLLRHLNEAGGAVLEAPPGAGKSTRVPLALLDAPWRHGGRILLLEPRRVAARAVATFMAARLGEAVGATVGYRTRYDTRLSADTVIEVVTEGILTRMLLEDPALDGYAAVLFDEFHERSLQADLGLALIHEVRDVLRDDLRVLVMSATLDGQGLAAGLGLPLVHSEGRGFPVAVEYRPVPRDRHWLDHSAAVIRENADPDTGTVLAFLPGVGEIERLHQRLGDLPVTVQVLHGGLPAAAQAAVLRADRGPRVVLATNVAETSVTIEGVTLVIDSGLERRPSHDPHRHRDRLVTRRISQANADQRAGRAGRLGPGRCLRLWAREQVLARHIEPEIRHTGLQGLVLDLARWGCRDPRQLFWLDPPPEGAWNAAVDRLRDRGALDREGGMTDLGRRLGGLPLAPEHAGLVLHGRQRHLPVTAARLAVLLEERPPGLDREPDLAERLRRFRARPDDFPRPARAVKRLLRAGDRDQDHEDPGMLLATAFPERVARRRDDDPRRYLLADGSGAHLPASGSLSGYAWLVILDTDGRPRDATIRLAWGLMEDTVRTLLGERATRQDRVAWEDHAGKVTARRVWALGAIEVDSRPLENPAPGLIEQGLLEGLRRRGLEVLPWSDGLRQWQARLGWLRQWEPRRWPDVSDSALIGDLDRWLAPFLAGRRSLRDLADLPLAEALRLRLGAALAAELDRRLPATVPVASGRKVPVDYRAEGGPRVAVKLQECFGMARLPVLDGGRLPLIAELLTPAGRSAAITADLGRFWRQGYVQVRKEMRGRYPKHPWPEDPLTAIATAGTKSAAKRSGSDRANPPRKARINNLSDFLTDAIARHIKELPGSDPPGGFPGGRALLSIAGFSGAVMKYDSIIEAADHPEMMVPEGWGQGRATFGGLVAAILIRHMRSQLGADAAPMRSFSLSFVAPMAPGPLALRILVLRSGKSVTQVEVTGSQDGQPVAVLLASLGRGRRSSLEVPAPRAPKWKPPRACTQVPFVEGKTPDFLRHFDLLYAAGNLPLSGADRPDFEGYMRFKEPSRYQDEASLACLVDTWPASVVPLLSAPAPMSSLAWTMEYLVDPATLPKVDCWQYDVVTEAFADGYGQSRSRIWDDTGRPVAFSRQTFVVFA